MNLQIRKLGKDNLDDFLYFFDNIAFCDNPDWAGCYCYFFHIADDKDWMGRTSGKNRSDAASLIEAGNMNGYLAYIDDKPVGWCNADDTGNYPRILGNEKIEKEEDQKVAAVVCFITDHNHRKKGIAAALLHEVCEDFLRRGYDYIEAYPRKSPDSDAENYHGPMTMFESTGFVFHKALEDFFIVRKYLK